MNERKDGSETGRPTEAANLRVDDLEARCHALARALAVFEQRCRTLEEGLAKRDRLLDRLQLEQRVLAARLDEGEVQARKTAAGLLERIEAGGHRAQRPKPTALAS